MIALFPLLPESRVGSCVSYMRIGQHSSADLSGVVSNTRPADPDAADTRALRAELERIGYNLDVRTRTPNWRALRKAREAAGLQGLDPGTTTTNKRRA